MKNSDTNRFSRLTSILMQLQTRRIITSTSLAEKFGVSVRTIYRDIKALIEAGVPIFTADGKGYSLVEGYKIPPVMFSESEANALITVGQLVLNNSDRSLTAEYLQAIDKVKAVLLYSTKDKANFLSKRIAISPIFLKTDETSSLSLIQNALTGFKVLNIFYQSGAEGEKTERKIEPFAFYYTLLGYWTVIAYCRLRNSYRMFRLDRMLKIEETDLSFEPHKLTLQEYLAEQEKKFITPDKQLS